MASVKDLLLSSLKELVNAELKKFQWHLVKDLERISKSEMEDADRLKTVDTLVDCFTPEEEAVKITVDILRKMKQNHLAEHLEDEHMQVQMSSGGHTGVSAVINTQKGGTVKVPVVSLGNLFPGPVTFNYSTAGHGSSSNDIIRWNRSSLKYRSKFEELQKDSSRKKVGNIYFSKSNNYKIGSGGSGTVYLGLKEDGTEVAIKLITKDQQENKYFENELKHLQDLSLESKNIVRSCNLRSSGLSIEPLLKCQACVHIADPDQWVQIEPSVCTDEGGSKFRVSTRPGRYECVRTRMRWVCDCDVTLQYQTVDGQFLNAELERLQSNRIAPVMDVTVISGKLEEVHLPHYMCLGESEASLRDAVKVLSVEDEGITVEPVQLTRFHAKILQPAFSIKTLIIRWIMRWDEHCDLLLYMRYKAPLILHVYLFPFDPRAKEEVEKTEKTSYSILHPRPDRPFRMKTPHILDVSGASVHPKEGITLRRETDPNFFKIKTNLENDLKMTLIREEDKKIVWSAIIEKDELDQIHPQREESCLKSEADKARYFDEHWSDFVQRVTNVQIIADTLLQQRLIHEEQYSEIKVSLTNQEGMRKICDIVRKHSDAVKAKLISVLQEEKLFHF